MPDPLAELLDALEAITGKPHTLREAARAELAAEEWMQAGAPRTMAEEPPLVRCSPLQWSTLDREGE